MMDKRFAAIAVGILLWAAGCTNSSVLDHGSATVRVNVVIANAPTRFDQAFFFVRQISMYPNDPLTASATDERLALINSRVVVEIDATTPGPKFNVLANLSTGPWRVAAIRLDGFFYEDFDAPPSTTTCKEFITRYTPRPEDGVDVTDFAGEGTFTVAPGVVNDLTITVDHAAFVSALQDSFFCFPRGVQGCSEAWCLFPVGGSQPTFNPAPLFVQAPQYLSFE